MRQYFVLSAVGGNRPGVVSDVSELIYRCGANIEDSRMSLIGNQFSLQILLSGEGPGLAEELRERCAALEQEKGIPAYLFPAGAEQAREAGISEPNYEIRVVGRDHTGIVYRTSSVLASRGINIVDLETRVGPTAAAGGTAPFMMNLKVMVPAEADDSSFRGQLRTLAEELGVEVTLSRIEVPG